MPNCGNVVSELFNKLNISAIFLLSFSEMPRQIIFSSMSFKPTKFGLNDMFENMKLFLKSSDQINSSMLFSLQVYIQVFDTLHYVVKIPPVPLYHSFENLKMP